LFNDPITEPTTLIRAIDNYCPASCASVSQVTAPFVGKRTAIIFPSNARLRWPQGNKFAGFGCHHFLSVTAHLSGALALSESVVSNLDAALLTRQRF